MAVPRRLLAVLLLCSTALLAQTATPAEQGKFILHKFEQPIGQETYSLTRTSDGLTLESHFEFTDRTRKVPLEAKLQAASDYTPQSFAIKGSTSRFTEIDDSIIVKPTAVEVRQGKETKPVARPPQFFTIAGYAPVALEMALMRYWRAHGSPAKLATLPSGEVQIRDRGPERFTVNGSQVQLEHYSIHGLVWGLETVWMDNDNNLAALVTRDAEFDHFEAVLDKYEPSLAAFVSNSARDQMTELEELARTLPGRRSGLLAFTGATLIDGTGKAPVPNATVVTGNGKILAAGANVQVPPNATRVDLTGKYVIPGLWDMHAHYEQVEWGPIYLAAGVTTVRDVGNEFEFITAVRDKLNSGQGLGPNLLLAGIVDGSGPGSLGINRVDSPADAAKWVKTYKDAGFQQIKIYSSVKLEDVKAICAEAHKLGMTVTGHIPEGMNIYDGVNAGMDQVNHAMYLLPALLPKDFDAAKATPDERRKAQMSVSADSPRAKELVAFLKQHGTVLDDTISLFELLWLPNGTPPETVEPGAARVPEEVRASIPGGVSPDMAERMTHTMATLLTLLNQLHRAGVPIVAGTDQAVPGFSVYREMELYVKAGFTPMEALQAATIVPARVMKVDNIAGTVEVGKRADFAILDANPLADIHNVRTVRNVVANGVFYDSSPLWTSVGFRP